jgi:hypothetical protein
MNLSTQVAAYKFLTTYLSGHEAPHKLLSQLNSNHLKYITFVFGVMQGEQGNYLLGTELSWTCAEGINELRSLVKKRSGYFCLI